MGGGEALYSSKGGMSCRVGASFVTSTRRWRDGVFLRVRERCEATLYERVWCVFENRYLALSLYRTLSHKFAAQSYALAHAAVARTATILTHQRILSA